MQAVVKAGMKSILTKKESNKWLICFGCTLLIFFTAGMTTSAFVVYQPYLISQLGLTNTQASLTVTIRNLSSLFASFFVQRYLNYTGLRRGVVIASSMVAIGFGIFAAFGGFLGCCFGMIFLGLSCGLGATVAVSIIISKVFDKHQSLAIGICSAGSGLATILFPPFANRIIEASGSFYRLLWIDTFASMLCTAIVFFTLRTCPQCNVEKVKKQTLIVNSYSRLEQKRLFCMFPATFLIGSLGGSSWSHLSVLYTSVGMDAAIVSRLISLLGISLMIGKLALGELTDRIGGKKAVLLSSVSMLTGQFLTCFASFADTRVAVLSMLFMGLGFPLSTVGIPVFATALFSEEHFVTLLKDFQLSYMIGGLVFAPIPGMIADAAGSYVPAYLMFFSITVVIFILIQSAFYSKEERLEI